VEYQGVDLKEVVQVYPSVLVKYGEDLTTISFQWYEENKESVEKEGYVLIFVTKDQTRKELFFKTYQQLQEALEEVSYLLENLHSK